MLGSGSFMVQVIPAVEASNTLDNVQPQDRLERLCHDKAANLLTQVAGLFVASTKMFTALARDAAQTSERIGRLQQRIDQLRTQVPHAEQVCSSGQDFSHNQRVEYRSNRAETSQLFNPGTAMEPVLQRHLANPPVPDLAPLDQFRSDGKPCIMFYTYPQFFLDEWVREQEREMAERKAKNAERRAERAAKQQKRTAPTASVKQVMKRVYDVDTGQLITVAASDPAASGGVERKAPSANQPQNRASSTYVAQSFPPPPATSSMPRVSPRPQHATSTPSAPAAANFPPPPPISSMARAPQAVSAPRVSPRPGGSAPAFSAAPPPPPAAPAAPAAPAFVPPPAPAGPPPPAAPPPPPEGSLAAQLDAVKAQTSAGTGAIGGNRGGGGLLDQIAAGVRLKKAEPPVEKRVEETAAGGFNVAAILARRAALEMSEESDNDSDWDD